MNGSAAAFLYLTISLVLLVMSVRMFADAYRNHYTHQPMRPLVVWIAAKFLFEGLIFLGFAASRIWVVTNGVPAPFIFSGTWTVLLLAHAVALVGFYSALRLAR